MLPVSSFAQAGQASRPLPSHPWHLPGRSPECKWCNAAHARQELIWRSLSDAWPVEARDCLR